MSKYYEQAKHCLFFIKNGGGVVELDINVLEVLLWLKWEDCGFFGWKWIFCCLNEGLMPLVSCGIPFGFYRGCNLLLLCY